VVLLWCRMGRFRPIPRLIRLDFYFVPARSRLAIFASRADAASNSGCLSRYFWLDSGGGNQTITASMSMRAPATK